jgi:hypothetical protein
MGTVIRPTLIPANDYTWTSMLQLQAILLAAEPAIDVIPNGAEEGLATRPAASSSPSNPTAAARFHD